VLVAAAAAAALAWAIGGQGCGEADSTPVGAARAFIAAAHAEDKTALWELLGPATRARVSQAAKDATDKVGGARRFAPLDVLDVAAPEGVEGAATVLLRDSDGSRAVVDVLGPGERHDSLRLVSVDGSWRVELDFPAEPR
jgi:hypothetical protein